MIERGEVVDVVNRYTLEPLHFPVDGYLYIVKMITSVDGGETFYYCGNSRYFKTQGEAEQYKSDLESGVIKWKL